MGGRSPRPLPGGAAGVRPPPPPRQAGERGREAARASRGGRAGAAARPSLPARCHRWAVVSTGTRSSGSRGRSERDGKRGKEAEGERGLTERRRLGDSVGLNPGVQDASRGVREEGSSRGTRTGRNGGNPRRLSAPSTLSRGIRSPRSTGDALYWRTGRERRAHGLNSTERRARVPKTRRKKKRGRQQGSNQILTSRAPSCGRADRGSGRKRGKERKMLLRSVENRGD